MIRGPSFGSTLRATSKMCFLAFVFAACVVMPTLQLESGDEIIYTDHSVGLSLTSHARTVVRPRVASPVLPCASPLQYPGVTQNMPRPGASNRAQDSTPN
eukprot:481126-Rhodomonas_salina.1